MSNIKTLFLTQLLITLIFPAPLWATACDDATTLVSQAYQLTNRDRQKSVLQQALKRCPNHAIAHNNLAVLFEKEGRDKQALYHYRQMLNSSSEQYQIQAWMSIGDLYYQQRQWPLSLEAYLQVCTRNQRARDRVNALLHENRYRTVEENEVMKSESLAVLYDKSRLRKLSELATQCQRQFKSITTSKAYLVETISVFRNLRFKTGQSNLRLVTEDQLEEISLTLINQSANKTIQISGHADSQPWSGRTAEESQRLNQQLSRNRAVSIKTALVQRGVPKNRIKIKGYGEKRPLVKGQNEAAWAKNRRVEIELND